MWVLALEGEVASDLSAFHRIDNMWTMGSRRWAMLVARLYAYSGAVHLRMQAILSEDEEAPTVGTDRPQGGGGVARAPDGTPLLPGPPSPLQGGQQIGSSQTELAMSPIGDMFSFAKVAAPAADT